MKIKSENKMMDQVGGININEVCSNSEYFEWSGTLTTTGECEETAKNWIAWPEQFQSIFCDEEEMEG